jgi:hypothetical protein
MSRQIDSQLDHGSLDIGCTTCSQTAPGCRNAAQDSKHDQGLDVLKSGLGMPLPAGDAARFVPNHY